MKGLIYLGKFIGSYIGNKIPHERQKLIRARINPNKICDWCLGNYKYQTKDGKMLCSKCYVQHGNELSK